MQSGACLIISSPFAFAAPSMSGSAQPKMDAASDNKCDTNALFVYGTLLSGYRPRGPNDLVPPNTLKRAKLLGAAKVSGFEMRDLGKYPCVVSAREDSAVVGEVYEVSDPAHWSVLDEYEGISDEVEQRRGDSYEYRREVRVSRVLLPQLAE